MINKVKTKDYHCVHFVIDAYSKYYGIDISDKLIYLDKRIDDIKFKKSEISNIVKHFEKCEAQDGCIVLATNFNGSLHFGLTRRGKIEHLSENGVRRESINRFERSYRKTRYYKLFDRRYL